MVYNNFISLFRQQLDPLLQRSYKLPQSDMILRTAEESASLVMTVRELRISISLETGDRILYSSILMGIVHTILCRIKCIIPSDLRECVL